MLLFLLFLKEKVHVEPRLTGLAEYERHLAQRRGMRS